MLLADIGGTNARFALLYGGQIEPMEQVAVADCPDPITAIVDFLTRHKGDGPISGALLGVAGTVDRGRCRVTNSSWTLDTEVLQSKFGFGTVRLVNDFEALAWSVPRLTSADFFPLRSGRTVADAPKLIVGPGTGFGASCLLKHGDSPFALASEAGHATLPAMSQDGAKVIDILRNRFGHASTERALSGPGIENLYQALATVAGVAPQPRDAAAITTAALQGSCALSKAALDMFCAILGTVTGNLALAFCARGGIYIGGGVVPRFPEYLRSSQFGACYEEMGRFRRYLREIPVNVITRPDATFVGLRAMLEHEA